MEKANASDNLGATVIKGALGFKESANATGVYHVEIKRPVEEFRELYVKLRDRLNAIVKENVRGLSAAALKEIDSISKDMEAIDFIIEKCVAPNTVTTEGKNAALTHFLKGSAYTSAVRMGLIGNTTYTAPDAADVASAINTTGSANGWNEATSSICASRGTPTFGTASGGSLALSANQSFSIIGTDTINGVFLLIKSAAGVDPTSTVGNTSGALYSAGAFTGGAKAVSNGDTLSVSYTASL